MATATASKSAGTAGKAGGLFEQAVLSFGDALRAGVKVQQEVGKWWGDALDQVQQPFPAATDYQRKARVVVTEVIPAAQKNAAEVLKLLEQNYQRSLALLQKAFDADPATAAEEGPARTRELWQESLELLRDNASAVAQANLKLLELWATVLRKSAEFRSGDEKSAKK
jgi:hypothetical protein